MNDDDDAPAGTNQDSNPPSPVARRLRRRSRRIDSDSDLPPLPAPTPRDPNDPLDAGPRHAPKAIRDGGGTEVRCSKCSGLMATGNAEVFGILMSSRKALVCMECGHVETAPTVTK